MTPQRTALLVATALLAASIQVAQAAPQRLAAEWRANRCCSTHCPKRRPPVPARRCCDLRQSPLDHAAATAPVPTTPETALVPVGSITTVVTPPTAAADGRHLAPVRAGPLPTSTVTLRC